jgi:aspartate/methionine/tyrosine aminotransferase
MKSIVKIPTKKYFNKAYKILMSESINLQEEKYDYYGLNQKIFDSQQFATLLKTNGLTERYKFSSGTSDQPAFKGYIKQVIADLKDASYYRYYSPPKGDVNTRKALALMESLKLFNKESYTEDDICLTEGSTGAITMILEYLKRTNSSGEVLIAAPTYYLYKFASQYYNLKFREIGCLDVNNLFKFDLTFFEKNITSETKLIILNRPNNPTGEVYSSEVIKKLLLIAKRKNILVLVDELFFELIFDNDNLKEADIIASEVNAMKQLILVKGYSKNKNLAAFRVGYLISKNKELTSAIEKISEQRQCFASAQNYNGVICLDAFIQSVDFLVKRNINLLKAITALKKRFVFSSAITKKSEKELRKLYLQYKKYLYFKMEYYSDTYDLILNLLKDEIEMTLPKTSAFNTLIKIKGMKDANYFDFCFNLFLTTGIETQIGPCFAFNQLKWEQNPDLGFWLRISFSRNKKMFKEGIERFIEFKNLYFKNRARFLKTDLSF